jgi:hypothetical protein
MLHVSFRHQTRDNKTSPLPGTLELTVPNETLKRWQRKSTNESLWRSENKQSKAEKAFVIHTSLGSL